MNQKQREYAVSRVNVLTAAKVAAIKEKHTTPAVALDFDQKISLIRAGYVLLRDNEFNTYTRLHEAFDFSSYERPAVVDQGAIDKESAPIQAQARTIKDKIMLGDAEEALQLISQFEEA